MNILEKIIFVADFTEDNTRSGEPFDTARKYLSKSLDEAVYYILDNTYTYLKERNKEMFSLGKEARDYYKGILNG